MNPNCLQRADEIVHGDRNVNYGEPKENHETTAAIFSEFMRRRYGAFPEITGEDVCWFNIAQKMSRQAHGKNDDGLIDIAGYILNIEIQRKGWRVAEIREQRKPTDTGSEPVELALMEIGDPRCSCGWRERHRELLRKEGQSVTSTTQENPGETTSGFCSRCGGDDHDREECHGELCPHCQSPAHARGTPCPKALDATRQFRESRTLDGQVMDGPDSAVGPVHCLPEFWNPVNIGVPAHLLQGDGSENYASARAAEQQFISPARHNATSSNPDMYTTPVPVSQR